MFLLNKLLPPEFNFIHRGEKYPIKSQVITSVSPVVSKLVYSPNPQNSIEIPPVEGDMKPFISILCGQKIDLDKTNAPFINFVAKFLQIPEIASEAAKICELKFDINDILIWADKLHEAGQDATNEINTVAANFTRLNIEGQYFSCDILEAVLSSDKLICPALYKTQFIDKLIRENPAKYERLSSLIFTDIKSSYDASTALTATTLDLNQAKDAMKNFLRAYKPPKKQSSVLLTSNQGIFGAIYYVNSSASPQEDLTKSQNPTVAENSALCIIAKTCCNPKYRVSNIIPMSGNNFSYISANASNESITVYFKNAKLRVTEYLIQSDPGASKGFCPFSWMLEGSCDGREWLVVDEVHNNRSLNENSLQVFFKVPTSLRPMSYFRLTQLDAIHKKNKKMFIGAFELFGELYP